MTTGYDLASFQLSAMTKLGAELRRVGDGAATMEEVAERIVQLLRRDLLDGPSGSPACSLVRAYRTLRYGDLDDRLRAFGARLMGGVPLTAETPCLTLLATAGEEPAWNSRFESRGHQTIPLPSEEIVSRIPMVSQLMVQLGLDVASVVHPDPSLLLESEQHTYNVFYVPEAKGSPFIPAQDEFVRPYGIRSVLGFGGLLPTGDMFAVLMFTKVLVQRATADIFRNAAMNTKVALLPFCDGPVFRAG